MATLTEVMGVVAVSNERGLKLAGAKSWLNWSQYAEAQFQPHKGEQVRCQVDGQGFLRGVEVLHSQPEYHDQTYVSHDHLQVRMWATEVALGVLECNGKPITFNTLITLAEELEDWVTQA
jgi:hypothetical protein